MSKFIANCSAANFCMISTCKYCIKLQFQHLNSSLATYLASLQSEQLAKMMLQSGCTRLMLLWLIIHCMIYSVTSSHFRGGIFMVRPKPGGAEREVSPIHNYSYIIYKQSKSTYGAKKARPIRSSSYQTKVYNYACDQKL